jgi:hypothetical protein
MPQEIYNISCLNSGKTVWSTKSLVDSMMIDAEFDKKNHYSIPTTAIKRGLELLMS